MAIRINIDVMLAKRKMSVTRVIGKSRHYNGEYFDFKERKGKGDPDGYA